MKKATVYKSTGSWYVTKTDAGKVINSRIKGVFKIDGITSTNPVAVGDIVDIEPENDADDTAMIFAQCHIDYRSPVHYDEELHVVTWIGEVKRSSFRIDFRMHVGERLCAEGYGWLVCFDYTSQTSTPIPERLRGVLVAAAD